MKRCRFNEKGVAAVRDVLTPIYTARASCFHNSGLACSKDKSLALAAG